jgi:hypothetical protein
MTNSVVSRSRSTSRRRASSSPLSWALWRNSWSSASFSFRCVRTRASTVTGLKGLWMKSAPPASKPAFSSSTPASAVRKMMGTRRVSGLALSRRQTS